MPANSSLYIHILESRYHSSDVMCCFGQPTLNVVDHKFTKGSISIVAQFSYENVVIMLTLTAWTFYEFVDEALHLSRGFSKHIPPTFSASEETFEEGISSSGTLRSLVCVLYEALTAQKSTHIPNAHHGRRYICLPTIFSDFFRMAKIESAQNDLKIRF